MAKNQDIVPDSIIPIFHYLLFGGFEDRDPGPKFSSKWYLDTYEDVRNARINPLIHFLRHGKREGREIMPSRRARIFTSGNALLGKTSGIVCCDPIIVHQMGKVGSQTVFVSLTKAFEALGAEVPIYHTHVLGAFEREKQIAAQQYYQQNLEGRLAVYEHGEQIRKQIDKYPSQHWNLVTLVRDPISRNVAAFFQNLQEYLPDWRERYEAGTLTPQEVQASFLRVAQGDWGMNRWFDLQLKSIPAFGIDVYETPFPHDIGYKKYPGKFQASLLLIRLENLEDCVKKAMHEFLGLENFTLHTTNVADDKDYVFLYRAVKKLPLPMEYVERMYSSRFAQHFYSHTELNTFRNRWTNQAAIKSF